MSNTTKALLLVEDNLGDARLLREMLNEPGTAPEATLVHVQSMADAEEHLANNHVDIVLLDLGLPDAQGLGWTINRRQRTPCRKVHRII
jgi:CheY-like chemotaxis protein